MVVSFPESSNDPKELANYSAVRKPFAEDPKVACAVFQATCVA